MACQGALTSAIVQADALGDRELTNHLLTVKSKIARRVRHEYATWLERLDDEGPNQPPTESSHV